MSMEINENFLNISMFKIQCHGENINVADNPKQILNSEEFMKKSIISAVLLTFGILITAKTYVPILALSPNAAETHQVSSISKY